ncbi:MAG: nitroreductase family protein [Microthrixaceae bacterium]
MELQEALRSTGAIRDFTDEPVEDETIIRILDSARFAPNGGNAQSWQVALVKDPSVRARIRDLYVAGFHEYVAMGAAGLRPWAPITDPEAEAAAIQRGREAHESGAPAGDFAQHFDRVPAMLAVAADLRLLAAMDRDLDRYSIVGGASVYPFVWSILLAAHGEGLGGVMTTMAIRREPELAEVLGLTPTHAFAAVVVLGHPRRASLPAHATCRG